MKILRCRDIGFDCDHEIRAERAEEVLQQAAEHARAVHNVEVTPAIVEQVRSLIKDENG